MTTNYRITGNTQAPPLYPLNSTTIPTVSNVTIASNLATATAAAGSFVTWDYEASNTVTKITPKFTMQLSGLTIDPTSATGSIKINYPDNNTLQVGSKILVTDGGVTTEQTIAAGSQSNLNIFTSAWGLIRPFEVNGLLIYSGFGNAKIAKSSNGDAWEDCGSAPYAAWSMCYFNGLYWIGVDSGVTGTGYLYSSPDLKNWTLRQTVNLGRIRRSFVATNGTILIVVYSGISNDTDVNNNKYYIYSTTDGDNFTQRLDQTVGTTGLNGIAETRQFNYNNGKFTYVNFANSISQSNDGITWQSVNNPISINNTTTGISWNGTLFSLCSRGSVNTGTISTSTDFTTWSSKVTGLSEPPDNIIVNGNNLLALGNSLTITYYSNDSGVNWTTGAAMTARALYGLYSSILNAYVAQVLTLNATVQTTTSPTIAWTNTNLTTLTTGYQFTITSPSLPVPDAVYLGGQTLGYSVQETTTPSWQTTTLTYEDSAGTITATADEYDVNGTHVVLRVQNLNNGDVVSMVGADLQITEPSPTPAPDYTTTGGINMDYLIKINGTVIRR